MLSALVLICSAAIAPEACSAANASSVIRVPQEYADPVTCLMHGEAYLAETSLELAADERVKVVCAPTSRAAALAAHKEFRARDPDNR